MKFDTLPLGELGANCYLLDIGGDNSVAIDIGNEPEKLLGAVESSGLKLCAILLTHGHYDHVGGVEAVREATGAAVYIHEKDAVMLESGQTNLAVQLTHVPFRAVKSYETLTDGQILNIAGMTVQVMHTPGHTSGSVCYAVEDILFTGDTLFQGSIGRTDLGGNRKEMQSSLQKLAALEGDYTVCPGHGGRSTLVWEKAHNPYLRNL